MSQDHNTECVLQRHKDGKLAIQSAPEIFLCTRGSIQDILDRHNERLDETARLGDADATKLHLDQIGTNHLSPHLNFDTLRKGRIEDGRRYLGNGAWQHLDHEHSETNERREGRP